MVSFPTRIRLLCALALAAPAAAPAAAQSAPVDFDLEPAARSAFPRFDGVRPGASVNTAIRLENRSRRPRIIRLQNLDLTTADTGGIIFGPDGPRRTGQWITVAERDVRLDGRSSRVVRLHANVPTDAAPGDHYAGVVAVDRAALRRAASKAGNGRSVELKHVTRLGLPVRFRVPGRAVRRLDLGKVGFGVDAAGSRIDVGLRNTGRRLVKRADADLRVVRASDGKQLFRQRGAIADIVPDAAIAYPVAWQGRLTEGRYRIVGTIRPHGAPVIHVDEQVSFTQTRSKELERHTGTPAAPAEDLPWLLLGALGAAVLVAGALAAGYLRLRRRLEAATGAAGDS